MKAKVILWGLLLLTLLSACGRPEEATPMPPTASPTPTPTTTEATLTPLPVVPTATEEATPTPPHATPTATKQATPTPLPATPTATTEATPTPQPTPAPEGIWPTVVARLELGVPSGNGYYPRAIAVNSATGRVYVRNERSDSEEHGNVSVIDGTTNEIIATIPVGRSGWDYGEVAVDETANRIYVANRGDKTLTVIGGDTHQVLATVEDVEAVAVDEARNRLYVAEGETIRLLDASDYRELRSAGLPPGSSVSALTLNLPADRLYLARSSPDALDIFSASTLGRMTSIPLEGRAQDLAVNTVANRLYAALSSNENDEILTFDGGSGDAIASLVAGEHYRINVLAVDEAADRLYVGRTAWQEPGVLVVNGATGQIVDQIGPASGVEGIALDPQRKKLYLSLASGNQVAVVDTEREALVALVPTAIEAVDAAVDPSAQRLYVTDSADQLHVFDSTNCEELAVVPGRGPLAVDDVRHRIYVGDPDGQGVQIIDGQTNHAVGLIPQTGKPVVNSKTNELYIVESGIYVADPETQSVVGKIDSTFPEPHGFPPNPAAVDLAIDPQLNLLYGVISNGVPGSGGGSYLQVYDGVTHTPVFTDTELSIVSIDVDPTAGRAYVTRSSFGGYVSLKVLAEGGRWVARLEGIVGNLRVDPNKGLVYLTSGWDKGHRLLIVDGQTADLLADVPLDGEYALRALDPLAGRLYLIGQGGSVLVMAESGGAPPAPVAPPSVELPASPIQRIVVSPHYTRDQTLLALVENELYKSEDTGESWVLISGGLPPDQEVVSMAFSPHYADDQTLLVGLSTWNIGSGIYRSTDGGRSWRLASRGLSDLLVQGVAFAADGTAFARTTRHGLFKSTDGGNRWAALEEPPVDRPTYRRAMALATSPNYAADGTLFWSLDGDRYVVLKSTDGGQSWEEVLGRTAQLLVISPPLPPPKNWGGKRGGDHTVYAVLSGAGLMRSTDGGETWQAANSGLFYEPIALSDLAFSPSFAEDRTLYVLLSGKGIPRLYRSTDGGDNWKVLKEDIPISAFALLPDGDLLLGTVYGSIDGLSAEGLVWEDLKVGLEGMNIYDLAISPGYAQDQTIYAATSKAGVFVSHDGGRSWKETGFPGRAGGSTDYPRLAISPDYVGDQTLFAASGAGVYRFVGGDWEELQEGLGNLFPASALAISPPLPPPQSWGGKRGGDRILFLGGDYRRPQVFISTDGGESWTSASQGLPKAGVAILAVSPNYAEDRTAYAWLQYQGLYRTTNGGQSWEQVTEEEDWYVQSMAISPNFAADQTLFVGAMYGNLRRSDDGGFTWQSLGGGLPPGTVWVRDLALSPQFARDGTLFAGLERGIYKSTDGGRSWLAVNTGLPQRPDGELAGVLALAISPDYAADQTIFAALVDHGVYKSTDGGASWYPATWEMPPPTPTAPAVTPTPCAIAPVRFAAIWADRRDRLGCAVEAEREVALAEQGFERGRMFWRGDNREIYVLRDDGTWRAFADTWQEGQPQDNPDLTAPPGLFQPKRGFGKVWREELGGPASQIGWAREEERERSMACTCPSCMRKKSRSGTRRASLPTTG